MNPNSRAFFRPPFPAHNALEPDGLPPPPPMDDSKVVKGALFVAGLSCCLEVRVFGRLSCAELMVLLGGVFYLLKHFRLLWSGPNARKILLLGGLWLGMQVVTDLVRATPLNDWARGWGRIVFFLTEFAVFYLLLRVQVSRLFPMLAGLACGLAVLSVVRYLPYGLGQVWKFGLALPVLLLTGLFFCRWPKSTGYVLALLLLAVFSVALSFRSFAGVCLASVALWCLRPVITRRIAPERFSSLARWLAASSVLILMLAIAVFSSLTLNGVLGEEQKFRSEIQIRRGLGLLGNAPVGEYVALLAGGRGEFVIGLRAILDAPLIGHGSWAKNFYYSDMWLSLSGEGNMSEIRNQQVEAIEPGLIPAHSHVVGSWVEAGLAGGVFWIYVLALVYCVLSLCLCGPQPFAPLLLPLFTLFIWDIFFSPMNASTRLFDAFYLAIAVCLIEHAKFFARLPPPPQS